MIPDRHTRSNGASPLRPGIYTGTASYRLENMSVADELHPVIHAGRVAVITGAASGIGKAAAFEFAKFVSQVQLSMVIELTLASPPRLGLKVAIADVDEVRLNEVGKGLIASIGEGNVLIVPTDVAEIDQVIRLKDRVYEAWGEVRIIASDPHPRHWFSP